MIDFNILIMGFTMNMDRFKLYENQITLGGELLASHFQYLIFVSSPSINKIKFLAVIPSSGILSQCSVKARNLFSYSCVLSPERRRFRRNGLILYQYGVVFAKTASFFTNTASFSPKRPRSLPTRRRFRQNDLVFAKRCLFSEVRL